MSRGGVLQESVANAVVPLAEGDAIRYNTLMIARRIAAISALLLLGLVLGGCTKCGWLWDNQGHACHSDRVN